jgi:hypothetical protein
MTKPFAMYDTRLYITLDALTRYKLWLHIYDYTVDTT